MNTQRRMSYFFIKKTDNKCIFVSLTDFFNYFNTNNLNE